MHIVMLTPEIAPAAKVGGLADVVTGLSKELLRRGHEVSVMLPMYHCMRYDQIQDLQEVYHELWVPHFDKWHPEQVYRGLVEGIPCFFFTGGNRFHRDRIYGYDDDMYRFAHFNRAALEYMLKAKIRPDILHCHDWQTGLAPVLLFDIYAPLGLGSTRALFTIHNIEHQGQCWYGDQLLGSVGLNGAAYFNFDRLRDNHKHNMTNLMKGGIVYSNFVTTVSPTYCNEICGPAGGRGLDATLNAHHAKLGGVLNGIDYEIWNPAADPRIALTYDAADFDRKYANKQALRAQLGLADEYRPLISCVTRLVPQKGIHLLKHALGRTLERGGQFVLLGDSPDAGVNNEFHRMSHALKDNPHVCIYVGHNEDLAHLIYAGSDLFIVPSLFEPCGLTQMIALRYGTVPIVRETGGLADTVIDLDNSGRGLAGANGFSFRDANADGVNSALDRALHFWFVQGAEFKTLAQNGMRCDFSWERSGNDYLNIYNYIRA